MTAFLYRWNLRDVERGLALLSSAGRSRAALAELKKPLKADQLDHAKKMEGPDGKWAPRAQSTVLRARRSKGRGRIKGANRRLLGKLPRGGALSFRVSGRALIASSKVKWAGIHQHGGTAGRGARIPARPFLWHSMKFFALALDLLLGRGLRAWRQG